jgi:hypothetical protein
VQHYGDQRYPKSEGMAEDQDQCEGNEDQQPGQEPSSEGETS